MSYAELDRAYRLALRRVAQVTAQRDELERRLLVEKGRHLRAIQLIDDDLERMARARRDHQVGHDIDAMRVVR